MSYLPVLERCDDYHPAIEPGGSQAFPYEGTLVT